MNNKVIVVLACITLFVLGNNCAFSQTNEHYEIGIKNPLKPIIQSIVSIGNTATFFDVELYGKIPVRSYFSVNLATGIGIEGKLKADQNNQPSQVGGFLKTGISKRFGKEKFKCYLNLSHVLSVIRYKEKLVYQDELQLWNEVVNTVKERKFFSSIEFEFGIERKIGKQFLIGASFALASNVDKKSGAMAGYRYQQIPGITGLWTQRLRLNLFNITYRFSE